MTTECTFKQVYTSITFNKFIDLRQSPYDIKNSIKNEVLQYMGVHDFDIILSGTDLREDNNPIDCNIFSTSLLSICRDSIYDNHVAFYIKPIYNNEIINNFINNYIISNTINNEYIGIHNLNNLINNNLNYYIINNLINNDNTNSLNNIIINDLEQSQTNDLEQSQITDLEQSQTNDLEQSQTTDLEQSQITDLEQSQTTDLDNICPVCYIHINSSENMTFGCHHNCCRSCVASWFRTNNISCPLCRA